MNLLYLYYLFAKIAIFTYGGGYAMIPLFENELVVKHAYVTSAEFANLVALAQITPGPIGLNAATYIGMLQGGFAGALAATLGLISPALIITMLAAVFLKKMSGNKTVQTILCGIRPCMLGIIAAAVIFFANTSVFSAPLSNLWNNKPFGLCWQGCLIFVITFAIQWKWKPNVIWLLIGACILGAML